MPASQDPFASKTMDIQHSETKMWDGGIAGWVRVYGEDAFQYLQSQCSQDVRGAKDGGAVYGLFLSLKGKVRADGFVIGLGEEEFAVVSYHCGAGELASLLEENVIADDVEFETMDTGGSFVVEGKVGREDFPGALVFPGRRMAVEHFDVLLTPGTELPLGLLSRGELENRRVRDGIVSVPHDIGPEELPQEGGLEHWAVSFTKGCFLGQEVMARLKAMGKVQRRIYKVSGEGRVPDAGTMVQYGGKDAGVLKSACPGDSDSWQGLALLRRRHAEEKDSVEWSLAVGGDLKIGAAV